MPDRWTGWRGGRRDGLAPPGVNLPENWPTQLRELWKVELGTGWSSPVVAAGVVVALDRQGNRERVQGLDAATGQLLWQRETPVDFDPHPVGRRHGNGPKGTPVIAGDKLYTLGIAGRLQCLELASGEVAWELSLPERFATAVPLPGGRAYVQGTEHVVVPTQPGEGAAVPLFGYTGSPAVAGDLLILSVGGELGGTVMALDRHTGEVAWQALEENVSYSSPVVARLAGVEQVVVMTGPRGVGLRLSDGELLWSYPFQIQYDESICTPVVAGDYVLFTGDNKPLTALRIEPTSEGLTANVAWQSRLLSSYLSSVIVWDDHVYGMNDGGEFACLELATGKEVWIDGSHAYYTTPLIADGQLLALGDDAVLQVLRATPEGYFPLATISLADSETWSAPAIIAGKLYIRSREHLHCFELPRD